MIDTLAADTTTPTIVVSHYPFQITGGPTQCGYILNSEEGELQNIIKAAPNVFATLNGHNHWNHVETYQNDYGDDITSHQGPAFGFWPGGYKVFSVYPDGDGVRLEWETRLVDNMGYRHFGTENGTHIPLSLSWRISTADGLDLVSDPEGIELTLEMIEVDDGGNAPPGYTVYDIMATTSTDLGVMELVLATDDPEDIYQDPMGGDLAPNPGSFEMFPSLEFDTYITMPVDHSIIGAAVDILPDSEMLFDDQDLNVAWSPAGGGQQRPRDLPDSPDYP